MHVIDYDRPYSIVFVGVNGVGKSTSLSKVCAYFLSKGLKVLDQPYGSSMTCSADSSNL
jgi:signal recognition particle GTPase